MSDKLGEHIYAESTRSDSEHEYKTNVLSMSSLERCESTPGLAEYLSDPSQGHDSRCQA